MIVLQTWTTLSAPPGGHWELPAMTVSCHADVPCNTDAQLGGNKNEDHHNNNYTKGVCCGDRPWRNDPRARVCA